MVGFWHMSTWIIHRCTYPLTLKPSRTCLFTPSLWIVPEHWLLSALLHALNLHWSSVLHMIIYMFPCYSFKSSHPHLLPHSPKFVLCVCVSFAALHIGSSLVSFLIPCICHSSYSCWDNPMDSEHNWVTEHTHTMRNQEIWWVNWESLIISNQSSHFLKQKKNL